MRSYRKYTDIQEELRNEILALRNSGGEYLESERSLAARFATARLTIAKALVRLETEGLISKTVNGRIRILPFQQRFRYAYVATVHNINGTYWFPAYQDLWDKLEKTAQKKQLKIDLILYDPDEEPNGQQLLEKLKSYDLIFVSLLGDPEKFQNSLENLPIIYLDENKGIEGFPLLALDNIEVGALAARILKDRGYRKTALIAPGINIASTDFLNRINGFYQEIPPNGKRSLFITNTTSELDELPLMQRCINKLPSLGFDSLFLLDDKWCILCDSLIETGQVPEFGILVFSGWLPSRRHIPPIDTISHGTILQAEKIIEIIDSKERGLFQYAQFFHCKVSPSYYKGKTLRDLAE